eukprot:CAMPEP_0184710852 /NCGR_PEP_ID=MMETSP0314-20130426/1590_1 /TAXON_ID=38298 /ORGANISM="Rhodella maculata, Strain CCMP 736" /LENGTH=88 /DNA_ID=CAMNT_0027172783 /DNA_START=36 /DNA_END=303 /DNA_ORIENTATION=-
MPPMKPPSKKQKRRTKVNNKRKLLPDVASYSNLPRLATYADDGAQLIALSHPHILPSLSLTQGRFSPSPRSQSGRGGSPLGGPLVVAS